MVVFYYSGAEAFLNKINAILKAGYKISGLMVSYFYVQDRKNILERLGEMRKKYGMKVMIDSGAYTILERAGLKKDEGNMVKVKGEKFAGIEDYDKYVDRYIEFLKKNKDVYDWAVELDIQKIVGKEKVEEWRKKFIENELNIVFVLHFNMGEGGEEAKRLKEMGARYLGVGEFKFVNKNVRYAKMLRDVYMVGLPIHGFAGFGNVKEYGKYIASVDATSWVMGGKYASLPLYRNGNIDTLDLRSNPILIKKILKDEFWDKIGLRKKVENEIRMNKYRILTLYSLIEFEKFRKYLTKKYEGKKYLKELIRLGQQGNLPAWIDEKDAMGRSKEIYLGARGNSFKTGIYAEKLHKSALFCDNCIVSDTCPAYRPNSVCAFVSFWKKKGLSKTRNVVAIKQKLRDIIVSKYERYLRAKYFEDLSGGAIDKNVSALENDLARIIEIYAKLLYGDVGPQRVNILSMGKTVIGGNIEDELRKVREEIGSDIEEKIRKRLEKEK